MTWSDSFTAGGILAAMLVMGCADSLNAKQLIFSMAVVIAAMLIGIIMQRK